tara:strand:+ start:7966 stop:8274 length:309 start_codon:yes stop_codon:yes gene_type:complete
MVKTITNANEGILSNDDLVVVDFWAPWCGPCRVLGPVVDEIANENEDITIAKVNVDDNTDLAAKYNIRGIPTILYIKGGKVINRVSGVQPKSTIQTFIDANK